MSNVVKKHTKTRKKSIREIAIFRNSDRAIGRFLNLVPGGPTFLNGGKKILYLTERPD